MTELRLEPDATSNEPTAMGSPNYEPWLFQVMLDELGNGELGINFIYTVLERLAERHQLVDVTVVLEHESLATQEFRLGGAALSANAARQLNATPGVYCEPPVVSEAECDAVRTACQVALSLQMSRFIASRDTLTSIANRRTFDVALENSTVRASRYGWPFTLIIIDLRGLKAINDRQGHERGDAMLRAFGFALRLSVRQGDLVARIGGDEFGVILNNAEGNESVAFVDRLRENLLSSGETIDFTVGAAVSPRDSTDPAELYRVADARLYAKRGIIHR